MKIVSGKTGTPHVTSEQFRQIIEGTVGQGSYILTSGENLEPELASNNMLKIRGGIMSHHGNVSCVDLNTYDEVTLTNGSQGVKRIDLVVNRYTRNDETGLEKNEWVVIIGTPDASNPKVPQHTIGNLQNGDLIDDCPVFEVHYDGINVTEVKKLLPVVDNLGELNGKIDPPSDSDIFLTGYAGGLWTGGGKNLCFSLPVAYNLSNIKKVIPTKITLTSRQAGSYCYGGADDHEEVDLKTDIVKIDPIKDMSQLNFSITFPTVRAKTNNDATGVSYSIFLKLQDF